MGLFDALRSETQPAFNIQRAIMTIVVEAISIDGNVSEEEMGRLRSMCARSPIFASNSTEEDDALIDFAINVLDQLGDNAIVHAAGALKAPLRETAFAFATEMVLADGMVGEKEEAFISKLAKTLAINEDLARGVIQVTLIRARAE